MRRMVIYSWEEVPVNNISTALQAMSIHNSYYQPKPQITLNDQKNESEDDEDDDDDDSEDGDSSEKNISATHVMSLIQKYSNVGIPQREIVVPQKTLNYKPTETEPNRGLQTLNYKPTETEPNGVLQWGNHQKAGIEKMDHFSHPHTLYIFNLEANDDTNCKICDKLILGFAYGCEPCDFFIHDKECRYLDRQIKHKSHPSHPLNLHPPSRHNTCDACRSPANTPFYRCDICDYDLHNDCANMPEIGCDKSGNEIRLYYSLPNGARVRCSECKAGISKSDWVWYNQERGYTAHFKCVPQETHELSCKIFRDVYKFLQKRKLKKVTYRGH